MSLRALHMPIIAAITLIVACSNGPSGVAGGGSVEVPNGATASIRHADGTPAVKATVRLRRSDWVEQPPGLSKSVVYSADALTDSNGRFEITGIDPGNYRIEVTDGNSAALLACSLDVHESVDLGTDTMRALATIAGSIDTTGLAGQRLYAQVQGLARLAAVDASGRFVLDDLPPGSFTIHAVTATDTALASASGIAVGPAERTDVTIPSGWRFSTRLYLNTTSTGADVAADVTGFPLLVRLNSTDFDYTQARGSGQDIRFAKADGSRLPYAIERWDATARTAAIWVRMDTVRSNSDRQFVSMFWGNPSTASADNGSAVFDTGEGFSGVWQLSDPDPLVSVTDQTANSCNGSAQGNWAPASRVEGIAGGALRFNGADNAIVISRGLPRLGTGNATISAWISTTDTVTQPICSFQNDLSRLRVAMEERIWFGLLPQSTTWIESPHGVPVNTPLLADGGWHRVAIAYERQSYARLFVDGRLVDSLNISSASIIDMTADSLVIGYDDFLLKYFTGIIDDVRYETTVRSRAWEKLCYENQRPDQRVVTTR